MHANFSLRENGEVREIGVQQPPLSGPPTTMSKSLTTTVKRSENVIGEHTGYTAR